MIEVIASLFALVAVVVGLGTLTEKVVRRCLSGSRELVLNIAEKGLLGITALALAGLLTSFVAPLNLWVTGAVAIVGTAGLLTGGRSLSAALGRRPLSELAILAFFVVVCGAGVYATPIHFDTGLYHLQQILWQREEPIVLGLANLHGRFGFNSVWLTVAGMLWLPVIGMAGIFLSNAVIFVLCLYGFAQRLLKFDSRLERPMSYLFCLITVVFLLFSGDILVFARLGMGPSTDLPAAMLTLYAFYLTLKLIEAPKQDRDAFSQAEYEAGLFMLSLVSTLAVTIKLSQIPVLLLPTLFYLGVWTGRLPRTNYWAQLTISSVFVALWAMRGVALSGCLIYPQDQTCISALPWAATSKATSDALWIKSWARAPGNHPDVVLGNWNWLGGWVERVSADQFTRALSATVAITLVALVAAWLWSVVSSGQPIQRLLQFSRTLNLRPNVTVVMAGWTMLVTLIGVIFWFILAPSLRFGWGFLMAAVFVSLAVLGHGSLRWPWRENVARLTIYFVLVGALSVFAIETRQLEAARVTQPTESWPKLPVVGQVENLNEQGITVFSPAKGDQCWAIKRPCTPYFKPQIRKVSKGIWTIFLKDWR